MLVKASKFCRDIPEECYEVMILSPKNDEVMVPWDADITVKHGEIVMTGLISPDEFRSTCKVIVEPDVFNKYYTLRIPDGRMDLVDKLDYAGWDCSEED